SVIHRNDFASARTLPSPVLASAALCPAHSKNRVPHRMAGMWSFHILLGGSILNRGLRYGGTSSLPRGVERANHPVAQLVHLFRHVDRSHLAGARPVRSSLWLIHVPFSQPPRPGSGA